MCGESRLATFEQALGPFNALLEPLLKGGVTNSLGEVFIDCGTYHVRDGNVVNCGYGFKLFSLFFGQPDGHGSYWFHAAILPVRWLGCQLVW